MSMLRKIISGGQTGADRAALDVAMTKGIQHGGFCPKGRKAEDGPIPGVYQLVEAAGGYRDRTERNAAHADGTVLFCPVHPGPGSRLTLAVCQRFEKPLLHIYPTKPVDEAAQVLRKFIKEHDIRVLNVAGSRASKEPGIYNFVVLVLTKALGGS